MIRSGPPKAVRFSYIEKPSPTEDVFLRTVLVGREYIPADTVTASTAARPNGPGRWTKIRGTVMTVPYRGGTTKARGIPAGFKAIHFQTLLQITQITAPRAAMPNQTKAVTCQPALSESSAMP